MTELSERTGNWDPLSSAGTILPSQYFALTGSHTLSSEQRLMLAVLVDAVNIIHSWRGHGSVRKRCLYTEAHEWVFTPGNGKPFSFESVCDGLGIEPATLRGRLSEANGNGRRDSLRLRLKESGRAHNVTVNRVRHRSRARRREQKSRQAL